MTTAVEHLLGHLEKVEKRAGYWMARCPAHNDNTPSLSVREVRTPEGEGRVRLKCFAGCEDTDVLASLGLNVRALFDNPRGRTTYNYVDMDLKPNRKVVRTQLPNGKKEFRQTGHEGNPMILYRLPEVVAGIAAGNNVFLLEGEADVDLAFQEGLVATTSPQGAQSWHKADYSPLKDAANIIVVQDRDAAGRKRGQGLTRHLQQQFPDLNVFLVEPREGNDYTDHIMAGHSTTDLVGVEVGGDSDTFDSSQTEVSKSKGALTSSFDTFDTFDSEIPEGVSKLEFLSRRRDAFYTGDQLQKTVFPEVRWAVPGLVSEGLTMLAGASKAGKSWFALALAFDITSGLPVLGGIHTDPGPVLYCALEDSGRRLQSRLEMIRQGRDVPEDLQAVTLLPRMPEVVQLLDDHMQKNPDLRMVIVDVFQKIRPEGYGNRNQYAEDYDVGTALKRLADEHNIPVVVVHHLRKMPDPSDVFNELSGSTGIPGVADTILVLKRPRNSSEGTLHVTGRDTAEGEYALEFEQDTGRWKLTGDSLTEASQVATQRGLEGRLGDRSLQLLKVVEGHREGVTPAQIAADNPHLEMSNQVVGDYLRRLERDGRIQKIGRGVYAPLSGPGFIPDFIVSTQAEATTVETVESVESAGQTPSFISTVNKPTVESVETKEAGPILWDPATMKLSSSRSTQGSLEVSA